MCSRSSEPSNYIGERESFKRLTLPGIFAKGMKHDLPEGLRCIQVKILPDEFSSIDGILPSECRMRCSDSMIEIGP